MLTKRDLYPAYLAAEEAWSAEGQRRLGGRWGDVRYTAAANGQPGTEMHRLYAEYVAARAAWHDAPSTAGVNR